MQLPKRTARNRRMNGGTKIAKLQSKKRTKPEESGYSTEPEQVMYGITRKEMKLTECVQVRKKNGLIM